MFYSHQILTRKGKLGIIWLAANYDGSRRFLSSRDFRKVNIVKACNEIINPKLPFALRLSSTLLVGVVRVHREQARIVLVEATDMMKAVKDLFTKPSADDLQMDQPVSDKVLTLPLLLDYEFDLPDFCEDRVVNEHLIALAKSDRYLRMPLPLSPFLTLPSPISSPEHRMSTGGGSEIMRSPFQAEAKDITIAEIDFTKLSPDIIQIPGELDIDGESLLSGNGIEMVPPTKPRAPREPSSKQPRAKRGELDRGQTGPDLQSPEDIAMADAPEDAAVVLFDQATGTFQATPDLPPVPSTPDTKISEVRPGFATPEVREDELQPVLPYTPRKRKLAIDHNIRLSSKEMRKNFRLADRLSKDKLVTSSRMRDAKELFGAPCSNALQASPIRDLWKENAIVTPMEFSELPWSVEVPVTLETSPNAGKALEAPGEPADAGEVEEEGISGIELLRAQPGEEASSLFEQSSRLDVTPDVQPSASRRQSRDKSLSAEKIDDIPSAIHRRRASSLVHIGPLSPIADEDFEPLHEIEEQATFLSDEEQGADFGMPEKAALETLSVIRRVMGEDPSISLDELLPFTTSRKVVARVFYHMMALTFSGILELTQSAPFADITISQGVAF
ncbi:double-strand-break repair protein rad21 homolog [Nematostella vectensis]|uniref:double-strand-break repair protein rad21 homolog n=1 Tax=Nematostella vectensis TaxID=45351 RepID=UPI00138FE873|nr:double-strand-break repair protein rad21 homolog [Nematostella vectensis]